MRSQWTAPFCCIILIRLLTGDSLAHDFNKIGFGLVQTINPVPVRAEVDNLSSFSGIFLNYQLTNHFMIQLEHQNNEGFFSLFDRAKAEQSDMGASWLGKDWSTKIFLQYYLKPSNAMLTPFLSIGAGRYYIHDSKRKIKAARSDPGKTDLDYAMRKYFRKPGLIGALGLECHPISKATFFLRGQCSVLFDENKPIVKMGSTFSDLINISVGFRLTLN